MINFVERFIKKYNMINPGDAVIVGLSGGADSVALLSILAELRDEGRLEIDLRAVHVHHQIRGEEADEDAKFAEYLANSLNVGFRLVRADVPALAKQWHMTTEEAGRKVRQQAFYEEKCKCEASGKSVKIALAHHMNDQAETVLFRMARGTGIDGMAGIRPVSRIAVTGVNALENSAFVEQDKMYPDGRYIEVIRPLLNMTRRAIEGYCDINSLVYMTDSTNADDDYSRNLIRNQIISKLVDINACAVEHIGELSQEAYEVSEYFRKQAEMIVNENCEVKNVSTSCSMPMSSYQDLPQILKVYIFKEMYKRVGYSLKDVNRGHFENIAKIRNTGDEVTLPRGVRAYGEYGKLVITDKDNTGLWDSRTDWMKDASDDDIVVDLSGFRSGPQGLMDAEGPFQINADELKLNEPVIYGNFRFTLKKAEKSHLISKKAYTKAVDYDKIDGVLCARGRLTGDYIVIDSEGHKKDINRLFIDAKVPKASRDLPNLVAVDDQIVWVPGIRVNHNFYVTEDTKNVLIMEYVPK